jgi:hypothetical protein
MNCPPCGEGGTRPSTASHFITSVPGISGQRPLDPIDIGGNGEIIVDRHGDTAPALVTPRGIATAGFDDINGRPETGGANSKTPSIMERIFPIFFDPSG